MINRSLSPTALLILFAALFAAPVQGQSVSEIWEFTPKPGAAAAFEDALQAHAAHRKSLDDPWIWQVYQ